MGLVYFLKNKNNIGGWTFLWSPCDLGFPIPEKTFGTKKIKPDCTGPKNIDNCFCITLEQH